MLSGGVPETPWTRSSVTPPTLGSKYAIAGLLHPVVPDDAATLRAGEDAVGHRPVTPLWPTPDRSTAPRATDHRPRGTRAPPRTRGRARKGTRSRAATSGPSMRTGAARRAGAGSRAPGSAARPRDAWRAGRGARRSRRAALWRNTRTRPRP